MGLSLALISVTALAVTGCSFDDEDSVTGDYEIVATTNVLADITQHIVGNETTVLSLMPAGVDPHSFSLSASKARQLEGAQLIISNGLNLESGLAKNITAATQSGVPTIAASDFVERLPIDPTNGDHAGHDEHSDDDPHFVTDPVRMKQVAAAISAEILKTLPHLDAAVITDNTNAYLAELDRLDEHMRESFSMIPVQQRNIVTNHQVLNYFADSYDFTIIGAVLPGGSSLASSSAAQLEELKLLMKTAEVSHVFVDAQETTKIAQALVDELGGAVSGISLVSLYTESLSAADGPAATYLDMMRYNTNAIVEALR